MFYNMLGFRGLAYCKWFNAVKGTGERKRCYYYFLFCLKEKPLRKKKKCVFVNVVRRRVCEYHDL